MFTFEKTVSRRRAVALIAGALACPAASAMADAGEHPVPPALSQPAAAELRTPAPPASTSAKPADAAMPSESCLAETLCAIKNRVRWRTAAWSPSYCKLIAKGILSAADKYDLSPALIMAIMMNESDMNEGAVATHFRDGSLYAKDSGLMGIRCVVGKDGRCTNGNVRGLSWKTVMDPVKNIELGARELALYRDGGGVATVTTRVRTPNGIVEKKKQIPCPHKTHAYWAHYNHGPRYIDKGQPRHYPHRIAVLYNEIAKTLNLPAPELASSRITVQDPGKRPRSIDKPVGARYRSLCEKIRSARGLCTDEDRLRTTAVAN